MRHFRTIFALLLVAYGCFELAFANPPTPSGTPRASEETAKGKPVDQNVEIPSTDEARRQARLLHETIHATLQIVHLRYFHGDEGLPLPAATLKSVFRELEQRQQVQVRWLAVNTPAMHLDHEPKDDFERNAAKSLGAGKTEYESMENGVYRFAGAITLGSECLSCHMSKRSSNQDRVGGLLISMRAMQH